MSSTNHRGKKVVSASSGKTSSSTPWCAACWRRSILRSTTALRVSSRWTGPSCAPPTVTMRVMAPPGQASGSRLHLPTVLYVSSNECGACDRELTGARRSSGQEADVGEGHPDEAVVTAAELTPHVVALDLLRGEPRQVERVLRRSAVAGDRDDESEADRVLPRIVEAGDRRVGEVLDDRERRGRGRDVGEGDR